MSDKDVTVDVHEIMQHLRTVGASASFVLNGDGHGGLDLDGEPTMRWTNFPEFVHKFRGLGRKAAVQRVIDAIVTVHRSHKLQPTCKCDDCNALRGAVANLVSIGVSDA